MSEVKPNVDARGRKQSLYQTVNDQPSKTIQSDAVEADIQTILKRHGVSGIIEHLSEAELVYGDVSEITDYADAMRLVKEAEFAFMKLPSKVREAFDHDAAKWLDAANDGVSDEQKAKLVKAGFLEPDADVSAEAITAAGAGVSAGDAGSEGEVSSGE